MSPESVVFALRAASVVVGAPVFGLLAAGALPLPFAIGAALAAAGFAVVCLGGAAYRILIAVARRRVDGPTAVSWTGATGATATAMIVLRLVAASTGLDGLALLAAYGIAINAAYLPAKFACLVAGCCRARPGALVAPIDLRHVEILVTTTILVAGACAALLGATALAAMVTIVGHCLERAGSRWARLEPNERLRLVGDPGFEFIPLTTVALIALRDWVATL